jgi:hypothetical protein
MCHLRNSYNTVKNERNWMGDMALPCLLCKYETLNSNPSPTKKKKKKEGIYKKFIYVLIYATCVVECLNIICDYVKPQGNKGLRGRVLVQPKALGLIPGTTGKQSFRA